MQADVTIVTVAGPGDEPYIRANIALIRRMSGGHLPRILVADNGKTAPGADGIRSPLEAVLLEGVPQNAALPDNCRASYQHSQALNHVLRTQQITTRYLLILDPDFYVIAPDWLNAITHEMAERHWAFFGAPWHPQWYTKYRYFPCVHCLCIDTHAVDLATLDFTPDLKERAVAVTARAKWLRLGGGKAWRILSAALRLGKQITLNRLDIGGSNDTGYLVYRAHHASPRSKAGLLQPVMPQGPSHLPHLRYAAGRWLESLVPDRFSFVPKKSGYFAKEGFAAHGLTDVNALQWEEFLWHDAPFGFHLRRFNKGVRDIAAELATLQEVLHTANSRS